MIKFNQKTLDAEMTIGDTGSFSFSVNVNNERILKDGDTVYFTVKKLKDRVAVIQKTITDFTDGVCEITINPSDTSLLDEGNYLYDLKLVRTDGTTDTLTPNSSAYFSLKRGVKNV